MVEKRTQVEEPQRYANVLAENIVRARGVIRDLTQRALANRMQALGFPWLQQTVARVERAKRPVGADELLGLAIALETTIAALLGSADEDDNRLLALPSGELLSRGYVASLVDGVANGAVTWDEEGNPAFGPEVRSAPVRARRFGEVLRAARSGQAQTIRVEYAGGTAVTISGPTATPGGYP